MTWLTRYRIRQYLEYSLWVFPTLGIFTGLITARLLYRLDATVAWTGVLHPDAARAVLGTLAASMFTCVVFVVSALLLVLQLASAQLTPRIIGALFRDPVLKLAMTVFVFTFALSTAALVRVGDEVPHLTVLVASYACVFSLALLLYLADRVGRALRPSGALSRVGRAGRQVILSVYKRPFVESEQRPPVPPDLSEAEPTTTFLSPTDGVVLAVDIVGLVALASRADAVIQVVHEVGDFIGTGEPLFRVFGGRTKISAFSLRFSIALGQERTLEQDPMLVFRILVDIASKALSAAINDPTTAVLAIDQIHHLLRTVAQRALDPGWVRDRNGTVRVVYPRPMWNDYVRIAVTEIRQFGSTSIQVARRLRAMLEDLTANLPASRLPPLKQQLDILRSSCERSFHEPEDRELTGIGDFQGVGGTEPTGEVADAELTPQAAGH